MGKQSRRRKADKQSHKERQKERRERIEEGLEQENQHGIISPEEVVNEVFVGDRVWVDVTGTKHQGSGMNAEPMKRCIVKSLVSGQYTVVPLDADGEDKEKTFTVGIGRLARDFHDWTLRFSVGDKVFCQNGVGPGSVGGLFTPENFRRDRNAMVDCYWCGLDEDRGDVTIPQDRDDCIIRHPVTFRFRIGQRVTFATHCAVGLKEYLAQKTTWMVGEICRVDITDRAEGYFVYECTFLERGRQQKCLIEKDVDEHVAAIESSPRQRLLEAIEQDCGYHHLDYIVTSSKLSIASFLDLVIDKAIKSASYNSLLWLQENKLVDLEKILDEQGNGLLYQISCSQNAERFFQRASAACMNDDNSKKSIAFLSYAGVGGDLIMHRNKDGSSWLHELVARGNTRALDHALSPARGFIWISRLIFDGDIGNELVSSTKAIARSRGNFLMEKMINDAVAFGLLYQLYNELLYITSEAEKAILHPIIDALAKHGGESHLSVAKRLIRFCYQWEHCRFLVNGGTGRILGALLMAGWHKHFRLLVEAEKRLLFIPPLRGIINLAEQYIQAELHFDSESGKRPSWQFLNHVQTAAKGGYTAFEPQRDAIKEYSNLLQRYQHAICGDGKDVSLVSYLTSEHSKDRSNYHLESLLEYKLHLLKDDDSLVGRLKALDFLVKENGLAPPSALDCIRWRQRGVLRWMLDEGFVDLQSHACKQDHFVRDSKKLFFLGGSQIPSSMSTGAFLGFAAIEFDDLQSFMWLLGESHTFDLSDLECNGWNAAHACAHFGRAEIILSLRSNTVWPRLCKTKCGRKPLENALAIHLAIEKGFIFVADLLLASSPADDASGRPLSFYTKKSPYEFVKEWGRKKQSENERPLSLQKDIKKLFQLLLAATQPEVALIKKHIVTTNALDRNRWEECNYGRNSKVGPNGETYMDIVEKCVRVTDPDPDFVCWLGYRLSPESIYDEFFGIPLKRQYNYNRHGLDSLVRFAINMDDEILIKSLRSPWAGQFECYEPKQSNPLLAQLYQRCSNDSSISESLNLLRDRLLHIELLIKIRWQADKETRAMFARGANPEDVLSNLQLVVEVSKELALKQNICVDSYYNDYEVLSSPNSINLDCYVGCYSKNTHPLTRSIVFCGMAPIKLSALCIVLALEGYSDLFRFCLDYGSMLDADMEIKITRIAAYLGHTALLDIFLRTDDERTWLSSLGDRYHAAVLGVAEAGKVEDVSNFLATQMGVSLLSCEPSPGDFELASSGAESNVSQFLDDSLVYVSVFGCLHAPSTDGFGDSRNQDNHFAMVQLVVSLTNATAPCFLAAIILQLPRKHENHCYSRLVDLLKYLVDNLSLDVCAYQTLMLDISDKIISHCRYQKGQELNDSLGILKRWLELLTSYGVDIQLLKFDRFGPEDLLDVFVSAQDHQLRSWSQFSPIKSNESLCAIKQGVEDGSINLSALDKGGLLCTHVASAYDRVEILEWLVTEKGMSLDARDGIGRTSLQVAESSNAVAAMNWIAERKATTTLSFFIAARYRQHVARRQRRKLIDSITTVQALQRGSSVRSTFKGLLIRRLEDLERFQSIWKTVLLLSSQDPLLRTFTCWADIKEQDNDFIQASVSDGDTQMISQTTTKLDNAATSALLAVIGDNDDDEYVDALEVNQSECHDVLEPDISSRLALGDTIRYTAEVGKWLKHSDAKYRQFFVRRMQQLKAGERSRILAKRLTGCKSIIYESYLEQKSGFRILWTKCSDECLLIWYIAKHKEVSRLARLIDDASSRSCRQLLAVSNLPEMQQDNECSRAVAEDHVILDPRGNTPLKLYEARFDQVDELTNADWRPSLYLTAEEDAIVKTPGSVLVLGRSGTGKTICICNRMEYDRERNRLRDDFSQLFVARSWPLRNNVEKIVGKTASSKFTTFRQLILSLESALPVSDSKEDSATVFLPSRKMDFGMFKRKFYHGGTHGGGLDALIVWTNIRTFIKGSIEALQNAGSTLSQQDYLAIGKRRCRLSAEQRASVYTTFDRYDKYMKEMHLWDDCDRIVSLLRRFHRVRKIDATTSVDTPHYSKVYVDEVQDYTQAEILLFFYLCGPENLFLAGDPAQSVVEGVEFRFEDIRSVGYHLCDVTRRHVVLEKPKTVNVNFRSHSGILNTAAAVLRHLFRVFPDSAKQLAEDRGLFRGPRPAVLHKVEPSRLLELISKLDGVVILTHDGNVSRWKRTLEGYPLVYGIREAKGLEFQSVILLDFFKDLPAALQKPWRDMLIGRDASEFSLLYMEVEGHLKLLYTAITRCINRLFFAETLSSVSGSAFIRWLTTPGMGDVDGTQKKDALGVRSHVDMVERMTMTLDEWRSTGLDNAIMAESSEDLSESGVWLDKSEYCFLQIGDIELCRKARSHRASIRLRANLEEKSPHADDVTDIETQAAQIMRDLLSESLLFEAHQLCLAILPMLSAYAQEHLRERFISRLPSLD